jgi:amidase
VEDLTWGLYLMSKEVSGVDYRISHRVIEQFGRNFNRFMKEYDLVLTATNPGLPFKLGEVNPTFKEPMENFDKAVWLSSLTVMSNASGNPAMSVPLGIGKNGLPIGTQFIGRFGDEALLFRIASQLEETISWNSL